MFDLFSSDHCPFRYDDPQGKRSPDVLLSFRHIPNGIPGVETRLPILFSEGVVKGRIDLPRFVALGATNHAKTYGLYPRKGTIAIGSDADIAIWSPETTRTIRHADLHDGADYSPYEGMSVTGWPETVILRGIQIVAQWVVGLRTVADFHLERSERPLCADSVEKQRVACAESCALKSAQAPF